MHTIVVADTVQHAKQIASQLVQPGAHATSPRSIKGGFGRGLNHIDQVLVDDSAWPLDHDVRQVLERLGAQIHRRRHNSDGHHH